MFAVLLLSSLGFSMPAASTHWTENLSPQTRIAFEWLERREKKKKSLSAPFVSAQFGVFPQIHPSLLVGAQLSTSSDPLQSSSRFERPDEVALADGLRMKSIGLRQIYISPHLEFQDSLILWQSWLGKFENPILSSPLLWDPSLSIEGLTQTLGFGLSANEQKSSLKVALFASQISLDQVSASAVNGTPTRRSWLFQQGITSVYHPEFDWELRLQLQQWFFYSVSEQIAQSSFKRGNSLSDITDPYSELREKFMPFESFIQISLRPFGVLTQLKGAFVFNWQSHDQDRGFWALASMGNPWKAGEFSAALSYYYNEPNTTVALFSDAEYGFTNRKGPRMEVSYFPLDILRVRAAYLLSETIENNTEQSKRNEIRAGIEARF